MELDIGWRVDFLEVSMNQTAGESHVAGSSEKEGQSFILGLWGVRYQVKDVNRSIDFYTRQLGFKLDAKHLPAFAQVSIGNLKLILSGPGASGSRPLPDGSRQEPGGWNRVVLQVTDLPARIASLKKAGLRFRNEMETVRAANRSNWKTLTATRRDCRIVVGITTPGKTLPSELSEKRTYLYE